MAEQVEISRIASETLSVPIVGTMPAWLSRRGAAGPGTARLGWAGRCSMSLREQLEAIRQQHGQLTPELVLEEARSSSHPLHSRFEWDDSVAAEKYRREQAHELIQSVRLTYAKPDGRPNQIRYYHAVRRPDGHAYEPAAEIVQDEIATKILMAEMERDWRALKKRYESFREFWSLVRSEAEVA